LTQSVGLAEPAVLALAEKKQLHLTPRPINPALGAIWDASVALQFQMVVSNRAALLRRIADRLE